jgi:transcriptional regulator with XRE-family HTH domain
MKNKFDISDFVPIVTEQSIKRELVKRFKQRRKEFDITQKELAVRSGISYASIRRFETSGEISLSALLRISSVIGCLDDFKELFINPIVKDIRK